MLGSFYSTGEGTPTKTVDHGKAFQLYWEAALKGLAIAQHNVASYFMAGIKTDTFELEKSIPMALEFWRMAAEQYFDLSCINLASIYIRGIEGDMSYKDLKKGKTYLDKLSAVTESVKKDAEGLKRELDTLKNSTKEYNTWI